MISYRYKTRIGFFFITLKKEGWCIIFDNDILDAFYDSSDSAASNLHAGSVPSLSNGVDTSSLNIPYDLAEWEYIL